MKTEKHWNDDNNKTLLSLHLWNKNDKSPALKTWPQHCFTFVPIHVGHPVTLTTLIYIYTH